MPAQWQFGELMEWFSSLGLEETAEAWEEQYMNKRAQEKRHRRLIKHQCSYCGTINSGALRACSLCKAAWYCNRDCQVADYKTRHKQECLNFLHPPFNATFLTEAIGEQKYAPETVFARGHANGVGCWVSVGGRIDGELGNLMEPLSIKHEGKEKLLQRREAVMSNRDGMLYKTGAHANSLLTLHMLVQNRRKDKQPVTVFPNHTEIVGRAMSTEDLLDGEAEVGDRISTFEQDGITYATVGVADDPWTKCPRICIRDFNGIPMYVEDSLVSSIDAILNPSKGILILQPGEYVIFHLQFRIGDGVNIRKAWQAFRHLQALYLPIAVSCENPIRIHETLRDRFGTGLPPPGVVNADFDHEVMIAYYRDALWNGEQAHIEAHHGKERAELFGYVKEELSKEGVDVAKQILEEFGDDIEDLASRMRCMGYPETAIVLFKESMEKAKAQA